MLIETSSPSLCMSAGELLSVALAERATVSCSRGVLWVTQDGDPRDIVLYPGETTTLEGRANALVQAMDVSTVHVTRAAGALAPARSGAAAVLAWLKSAVVAFSGDGQRGAPDVGALMTAVASQRRGAWASATGVPRHCEC